MTTPSKQRKRRWSSRLAAAIRWIHIYISMLGFAALMFFGFTGLTLNHPTWLGAADVSITDLQGELPRELLPEISAGDLDSESADGVRDDAADDSSGGIDKLAIAEWFRREHHLSGSVSEFSVDEFELFIVYKGPAYSVDVFVDRGTRKYSLTETRSGMMAALNDLHKGRDSGAEWSVLIDVSAVITLAMSVSGLALVVYIRRRRATGIVTAVVGTIAMVVVWVLWVP